MLSSLLRSPIIDVSDFCLDASMWTQLDAVVDERDRIGWFPFLLRMREIQDDRSNFRFPLLPVDFVCYRVRLECERRILVIQNEINFQKKFERRNRFSF